MLLCLQVEWDGTIPLSQQCAEQLGITGFGESRCGLTTRDRVAAAIQVSELVGVLNSSGDVQC